MLRSFHAVCTCMQVADSTLIGCTLCGCSATPHDLTTQLLGVDCAAGSVPLLKLLLACGNRLDKLFKLSQKPSNWIIDVKVGCRCKDCKVLQAFLLNATQGEVR